MNPTGHKVRARKKDGGGSDPSQPGLVAEEAAGTVGGAHNVLVQKSCSLIVDPDCRAILTTLTEMLCTSQYVSIPGAGQSHKPMRNEK